MKLYDRILPPRVLELPNGKQILKYRSRAPLWALAVALLTALSVKVTGFDMGILAARIREFFVILGEMLPPDWGYLSQVWQPLFDTIKMSLLGSAIGSLLVVPFAMLASTNIIRSLSSFLFMIVSAYASTCGSLVSNLIGAGRADSVTYTIRQHVRLAYICVLPLAAFFSICPRLVISIYSDIPELIDASVPSLWVLCSAYLFMAPSNIYFQSISGTGNTRMAFALELCALVLYVAYCFFIIMYLRLDVAWCWTSEIAYALLIFAFSYTYIRSGRWRGKTL